MSLTQWLGLSGVQMRLRSPQDELVDRWLGIRTIGWRPPVGDEADPNHQVDYLPSRYSILRQVLKKLELSEADMFVDLGAGLGRAVFVASWLGAGRAIGVEIDPSLVSAAKANLKRSRFRSRRLEFVQGGAGDYPQDETTAIYMYHPFGAGTMREVAVNIAEGLRKNPRRLRIAYLNPVHADVLDSLACLERYDEMGLGPQTVAPSISNSGCHAIFWRSL